MQKEDNEMNNRGKKLVNLTLDGWKYSQVDRPISLLKENRVFGYLFIVGQMLQQQQKCVTFLADVPSHKLNAALMKRRT